MTFAPSRVAVCAVWCAMASSSSSSSRPVATGGYEYAFSLDPIPEQYLCHICMKVLREAHVTECCKQYYCKTCLNDWISSSTRHGTAMTCPYCRTEDFKHNLNSEKVQEILKLEVRCTHQKEGCEWVGELMTLRDHLISDSGCGYVNVSCPFTSDKKTKSSRFTPFPDLKVGFCPTALKRKDLMDHKEQCINRPYQCRFCGHWDTYVAIEFSTNGHYSICPEYQMECPNKCGATDIKRKNFSEHGKTCPLESAVCPFSKAGCGERGPRRDILNHIKERTPRHMLLLLMQNQELSRKNQELSQRVEELTKSGGALSHRVDEQQQMAEKVQKLVGVVRSDTNDLYGRVDELEDHTDSLQEQADDLEDRTECLEEY